MSDLSDLRREIYGMDSSNGLLVVEALNELCNIVAELADVTQTKLHDLQATLDDRTGDTV